MPEKNKAEINDFIALRFQGRFMVPLQFDGAGAYIGTGGGDFGLSSNAIALRGDFSSGIIFKIY